MRWLMQLFSKHREPACENPPCEPLTPLIPDTEKQAAIAQQAARIARIRRLGYELDLTTGRDRDRDATH